MEKRLCLAAIPGFVLFLLLPVRSSWAVTYAYIPSYGNGSVVRIDTSDPTGAGSVATFAFTAATCSPYGIAVAADDSDIIVTCKDENAIAILTNNSFAQGGTAEMLDVGTDPRGVAFDPGGQYAYVANYADDTVSVIDMATHTEVTVISIGDGQNGPSQDGPWGIAAVREPTTTGSIKVYVANYLTSSVSVITDNSTTINNITGIGSNPIGMAATPDGDLVFVANNGSHSVQVISTSQDEVIATIATSSAVGPWGVTAGSQGEYIYATNSDANSSLSNNSVTVIHNIDNNAFEAVATPTVGGTQPLGVAAPINGDFAYVISQGADTTSASTLNQVDITGGLPTVSQITPNPNPIEGAFALGTFFGGTPPAAPSNLSGTASSPEGIDLTWTDNSDDELGFMIERRVQGDTDYVQIAQTGANATSFSDSVASNTTYEYRIRAFNETSYSGYVDSAAITTPEETFHWCFIGTAAGEVFGAR
jgi:YVTN family beta-propeller protein